MGLSGQKLLSLEQITTITPITPLKTDHTNLCTDVGVVSGELGRRVRVSSCLGSKFGQSFQIL
jgi:hypothetical protein